MVISALEEVAGKAMTLIESHRAGGLKQAKGQLFEVVKLLGELLELGSASADALFLSTGRFNPEK